MQVLHNAFIQKMFIQPTLHARCYASREPMTCRCTDSVVEGEMMSVTKLTALSFRIWKANTFQVAQIRPPIHLLSVLLKENLNWQEKSAKMKNVHQCEFQWYHLIIKKRYTYVPNVGGASEESILNDKKDMDFGVLKNEKWIHYIEMTCSKNKSWFALEANKMRRRIRHIWQ